MTGIHSHPAPLIVAKPLFVATTRQKYLLLLFDLIIMMDYLSFNQWRSGRDWSPRTQNPDKPAFSVGCSASKGTIQFNKNMSQWSIRDCNSSRNFISNYYEWVSRFINPQIQCNKLIQVNMVMNLANIGEFSARRIRLWDLSNWEILPRAVLIF